MFPIGSKRAKHEKHKLHINLTVPSNCFNQCYLSSALPDILALYVHHDTVAHHFELSVLEKEKTSK